MTADTYVTLLTSTIDTPAGEDNVPITDGKGLQASHVIFDSQAPDLDLNITLTFFDIRSLNLSQIVLQKAAMSTPGSTYRLTSGTMQHLDVGCSSSHSITD